MREADLEGTYTFVGWDCDTTNIQCDMIINAEYSMEVHSAENMNYVDATCTENGYSGDMLNNELQILPFTANYSGGYYWIEDVSDDRIWIYKDGYIYSVSDGKLYYLTVQYTSFYSYTVAVTEDISQAVQWTYNNGSLYTNYSNGSYTTNLYLYMSGNKVKVLRNRNTKIVLYEQVQIAL